MTRLLAVLLLATTMGGAAGAHGATEFATSMQRVQLVELFTSEGCSSCPPAEVWLRQQTEGDGLWTRFVPVAQNVTYWDRLGWPDPLARREFTERQRAYAEAWGRGSVYTPGFVVDGAEWRGYFDGQALPRDESPAGRLHAAVSADSVQVRFAPAQETDQPGGRALRAHVALLGTGIRSEVRRGENAGRDLTHDFVALGWETALLQRVDAGWTGRVALPASDIDARRAVAVWITEAAPGSVPLQATGGWLTP